MGDGRYVMRGLDLSIEGEASRISKWHFLNRLRLAFWAKLLHIGDRHESRE